MKRCDIAEFTSGGVQYPALVISVDEIENTAAVFVFSVRQGAYPVAGARISDEYEENCVTPRKRLVGPAAVVRAEQKEALNAATKP